jgi:Ni/Co efflux regulator RcnB
MDRLEKARQEKERIKQYTERGLVPPKEGQEGMN